MVPSKQDQQVFEHLQQRSLRRAASLADLRGILEKNREWAEGKVANDPDYFQRLVNSCTPDWMWIGCADSRVPANELLGLGPGEVLVQRNVGNLASHKDPNCMSSLEYAVSVLKVKHVLVCGHFGCGAVRAALTIPCKTQGLVNLWIQDIRDTRDRHVVSLRQLSGEARVDRLVELNTLKQVLNVCTSPVVQNAWDQGQRLAVHGLVYRPTDGVLRELTPTITCLDEFECFSAEQVAGLQRASLSVLDKVTFEQDALRFMQGIDLLIANVMAWQAQEQHYQQVLEQTYWAQQEVEYHKQLQEYYMLRQQHQINQQRLNQVLYGSSVSGYQHTGPAAQHSNSVQQEAHMILSPVREPLRPLGHDNVSIQLPHWQKACYMEATQTQLVGRKRPSDFIEIGEGKRSR